MWIYTPFGFFSIVQAPDERMMVRARVRADLDRLRDKYLPELTPTLDTPIADYPHRAFCSRGHLTQGMIGIVRDITYANVKNASAKLGTRHSWAYHDVHTATAKGLAPVRDWPRLPVPTTTNCVSCTWPLFEGDTGDTCQMCWAEDVRGEEFPEMAADIEREREESLESNRGPGLPPSLL